MSRSLFDHVAIGKRTRSPRTSAPACLQEVAGLGQHEIHADLFEGPVSEASWMLLSISSAERFPCGGKRRLTAARQLRQCRGVGCWPARPPRRPSRRRNAVPTSRWFGSAGDPSERSSRREAGVGGDLVISQSSKRLIFGIELSRRLAGETASDGGAAPWRGKRLDEPPKRISSVAKGPMVMARPCRRSRLPGPEYSCRRPAGRTIRYP